MRSRSSVRPFILAAVLASPVAVRGQPSAPEAAPLALEDLLQQVARENPGMLQARRGWESAARRVVPAGTWPDPMVFVRSETMDASPKERKREIMVSQAVPFPGKLSSDAAMRRHEALIAWQAYRARAVETLTMAKEAYYRLHRADRTVAVLERTVELLRELTRYAQARLASGKAESGDAFLTQTELEEVKNLLLQARSRRLLDAAELNRLHNRPPEDLVGPIAAPELRDLPADLKSLQEAAAGRSPEILASLHEIEHAGAMLRRSRLGFAPDFQFSYEDQSRSPGPRGREIGVGISLPLWWRRPADEVRSARSHLAGAQAGSETARADAARRVHEEFVEAGTHLELARSYRDVLIPLARGSMQVMQRGYESGRTDILKVVEASRMLLKAQLEYENEAYHFMEHWALLERWSGVELSGGGHFPPAEAGGR